MNNATDHLSQSQTLRIVGAGLEVLDQRSLPHAERWMSLDTLDDFIFAIREMVVRGAPLIGVTAAFGIAQAARASSRSREAAADLDASAARLVEARPTAVNLSWAVQRQMSVAGSISDPAEREQRLFDQARALAEEDAAMCWSIGEVGLPIIEKVAGESDGATVNVLTHCNAGALATSAYGTATSPIYRARANGIQLHVWVDETRPRLQGAKLTAYELGKAGVDHTIIADSAAAAVMAQGRVDLVIVGCDRLTRRGDVVNKIGTYSLAIAAARHGIPFYVALPSSTFDSKTEAGTSVAIEERSNSEISTVAGAVGSDDVQVKVTPPGSPTYNPAFDVTPAELVTALITEQQVYPSPSAIAESMM